jgi:hypothetical protein
MNRTEKPDGRKLEEKSMENRIGGSRTAAREIRRSFSLIAAYALRLLCTLGLMASFVLLNPVSSSAHGLAGKRFFPTTLAIDDPFVSDEFSLLGGHIKEPGEGEEPSVRTTEFSYEWAKRITPSLGLSIAQGYLNLKPEGEESKSGFGNLELGIKYQFFTNAEHETILSLGIGTEIGGTGAKRVGAESFSVISPALFFGKGLGDLPESMTFLRPLAITGVIGPNFPTRSKNVTTIINGETGNSEQETERNPVTLTWGFSVQYNLQYLQSFVQDTGLGAPLNRMIILVEFPFETCMIHDCKGQTTGFVNPGLVWFGKSVQLGIEAQIPVNERTGKNVGVLGLVHLFIDDLFPDSIGSPIFH